MRARLAAEFERQHFAAEASAIVRSCVHCGLCNATCPTYQLTGDELDGPRGRIYLIKSLLEDSTASVTTQTHLDRCLLCRNCETTCPSGVNYSRLYEIARPVVGAKVGRGPWDRLKRYLIAVVVGDPSKLALAVALGRTLRPVLPPRLRRAVPPRVTATRTALTRSTHARRIVLLRGCAQPVLNPAIDAAATRVFDRLGIAVIHARDAGCCGALAYHLGLETRARGIAKANIDAWWSHLERGCEAIVATASGCSLMLKEYAEMLAGDGDYADRARHIAAQVRDPIELIGVDELDALGIVPRTDRPTLAFHAPCTLQHGAKLGGRVEALLRHVGWDLQPVHDAHSCCGSAGAYSLLEPLMANDLKAQKLENLMRGAPQLIVTANIGCQTYLATDAPVPVRHWLELLDEFLPPTTVG